MGRVIDLKSRRGLKPPAAESARVVTCAQCKERHPVIRLADGTRRCVTAFADGERWFCSNRGCRAAWVARPAGQ